MTPPKPTVLLLADAADDCDDVARPLASAGYALRTAAQAGTDTSFARVEVVAVAVEREAFAVAATRRVRADTADSPVPVLWLLTEATVDLATVGLAAGADVCLVRPVGGELLVAQVDALRRTREQTARFAARGSDAGDLAQRLQKVFRQADTDAAFARRLCETTAPADVLAHGPLTAAVARRAPALGVSVCEVVPTPDGRLRVVLVDVGGLGQAGGTLLAQALARGLVRDSLTRPPGAALTAANVRLLALDLPDGAMIAAAVAEFDPEGGRATVACGGLPAPIRLTRSAAGEVWSGSGPFLGVTATTIPDMTGTLEVGDRLLLLGGCADRRPDVREAADRFKELPTAGLAKAIAGAAFASADAADGFTLVAVGRAVPSPSPLEGEGGPRV